MKNRCLIWMFKASAQLAPKSQKYKRMYRAGSMDWLMCTHDISVMIWMVSSIDRRPAVFQISSMGKFQVPGELWQRAGGGKDEVGLGVLE